MVSTSANSSMDSSSPRNGWVQSYGSRYVALLSSSPMSAAPPITVKWSSYAQSVSKKPMKEC